MEGNIVDITSERARKFYSAISAFNEKEVVRLVEEEGYDVNMIFHNMSCWGGNPNLVGERGTPTYMQNVLSVARASGSGYHHKEMFCIIWYFLEKGVDPNKPCEKRGNSDVYPLECPIMAGEEDIIKLYLDYGANPLQPTSLEEYGKPIGTVLELARYELKDYFNNDRKKILQMLEDKVSENKSE